ncbi:MFS transporter [bacterium]|nr:MFS transporter [bacterium]
MRYVQKVATFLLGVLKTLRLALPKIGVGWMFALLTIDFNRISIVELGVTAVLITSMLGLHYLLSPFQVIAGRFADQHPIFGLRRTPFLLLGAVMTSSVFVTLPTVAHALGDGLAWAIPACIGAFIVYGVGIAIFGDSHHSLIAEVTTSKTRGGVITVVQMFTILSGIMAAVVMNIVRPEYTREAMQSLYNLTPFIVISSALLGVIGMEKRLKGDALTAALAKSRAAAPVGNPVGVAIKTLRENKQARGFFFFVFISIFAIFLQDNILEVFGAEVFGMSVQETTRFQPTWGGGVLVGMMVMGLLSVLLPISKRWIAIMGAIGTSAGMAVLAGAALTGRVELVHPALMGMGLFTGFFNVGALSMMMDMTIEGATGLYMGLWGMAQAFGNGSASFGSGALHTGLIESGLLAPNVAYFAIFGVEAVAMLVAAAILMRLSVKRFHALHQSRFTRKDIERAMEAGVMA